MTGEARGEIVETLIAYPLQCRVIFHQRKAKVHGVRPFDNLHNAIGDVVLLVKTVLSPSALILLAMTMFGGTLLAGSPVSEITVRREQPKEVTVFVTGSLIPQRVRLQPVGTTTASPVRIIDRREIDGTGRLTTAGAFVNEPSLRIVGFGH
jgi:hypothetical protein